MEAAAGWEESAVHPAKCRAAEQGGGAQGRARLVLTFSTEPPLPVLGWPETGSQSHSPNFSRLVATITERNVSIPKRKNKTKLGEKTQ